MEKDIKKKRKLRYRKVMQSPRAIEQAQKRASAMIALASTPMLSKRTLCKEFALTDRTALDLKDKVNLAKCLGIDMGKCITDDVMQKGVGERALDAAIIEKASQVTIFLAKIILCTTPGIRRAMRITLEDIDNLSGATLKNRLEKYRKHIGIERE